MPRYCMPVAQQGGVRRNHDVLCHLPKRDSTPEKATKQYKVLVYTNGKNTSRFSLTLVDSNNKTSEATYVKKSWTEMFYGLGKEITIYINVEKDLGDIVKVKIEKYDAPWFCSYVRVKSPSGKSFEFPCYSWLEKKEGVIREGSARLPQDDSDIFKEERKEEQNAADHPGPVTLTYPVSELQLSSGGVRRRDVSHAFPSRCVLWVARSARSWILGTCIRSAVARRAPPCLHWCGSSCFPASYHDQALKKLDKERHDPAVMQELHTPTDLALRATKMAQTVSSVAFVGRPYHYKVLPFGLALSLRAFTMVAEAARAPLREQGMRILNYLLGERVALPSVPYGAPQMFRLWSVKGHCLYSLNLIEDWNTDYMFGYQYLNGCNPVMIRKCVELPKTFPVTHEMVEGSLQRGLTLQQELEKGNIYIADYEILDGLTENKINQNTKFYLTAPICLLYNNRLDQIVPIAIQLSQRPGESSPIFLPNDKEHDWMLAKMWVKSSDFIVHQLVTHLLKTHLISEVFEVAMYRQLSPVHPVYKLLIPHVRFTIAINTRAREKLISEDGFFSKTSSISAAGIEELMERAMKTLTYKSMCFPEAIIARGMENTPKYYYRDDGMKIWEAIYSFVDQVIKIYYDSDEKVQKDVAIQHFVKNVNFGMEDFISDRKDPEEFPQSLKTREELVEYLTAVIFNASAQHAAVNFGQFEWYGWIPNSPSTMRKPPPREKDSVDVKHIMNTLPDRDCSRTVLGTVWALSRFQENERYLGMYPDMHFTEQPVKEAIMTFRQKLDELTDSIKQRNKGLTMSYCYLSPDQIPNSVAI
ncbi:polyunsaturated fatty acid 5-lipoxygenase-like [Triplophysa dalaica]|uniref:polyunsaturated fatty acid 5-lipoxygenase-like n=1 Tax=Triplophysa dalaica TaxID=1582913 RepID=UPI0024E03BAB|nr:polyunsaturated fatty acid 5-lipoxygenase-like [Triplophysa dalaica]